MILQTEQTISVLRLWVWLYCTLVYLQVSMLHCQSWTLDHGQRHLITFRPISKAAYSWSYDNRVWMCVQHWNVHHSL